MKLAFTLAFALPLLLAPNTTRAEDERIDALKAIADQYKVKIEEQSQRGIVLRLPDGMDSLPGFKVTKDPNSKNVVLPSGDPLYVLCMKSALEDFAVASAGGSLAGGVPGFLLGVGIGGAVASRDASKCRNENASRLFDALSGLEATNRAKGITVELQSLSKELSGMEGELTDVQSAVLSIQLSMKEDLQRTLQTYLSETVTKEELEKAVAAGMAKFQQTTRQQFAEARDQQITAAKVAKAKTDIQLTEQGLTVLVGLVAQNDPKLAGKINRGIAGASRLAQIAVGLTVASPFEGVMLSLSAVGVISSLFGSNDSSSSFNQALLDNIDALRTDISTLRGEMLARFDALQQSLAAVAEYMKNGFLVMDTKLDALKEELDQVREEADIRDRLQKAAITYLLQSQFKVNAQTCLEGVSSTSLNLLEFGKCLGNFKLYATDVARADMIAGSDRVAADPLGDVSAKFYLGVDTGQMLGYLATLDQRVSNWPTSTDPPSPLEWSRAIDAYTTLVGRYDSLHLGKPKNEMLSDEAQNVAALISAGKEIKSLTQRVRGDGALAVLALYSSEMKNLAELLTKIVADDLSKRPLGITQDTSKRGVWWENTRGSSSWVRPCARITRAVTSNDGSISSDADQQITEVATQCFGDQFTNRDTVDAVINSALEYARQVPESTFAFSPQLPHDKAVQNLQALFLERQATKNYSDQVKDQVKLALDTAASNADVQKFLGRLTLLQNLVLQQIILGEDDVSDPQIRAKIEAIQSLASTVNQLRPILSVIDYKSDKPLAAALPSAASVAFAAEQKRVNDILKNAPPNDSFPFVDRGLTNLRSLQVQ